MLEISINSTSIMRGCPMKYRWRYIDGLVPYKKSSQLSLGSVVHSAFNMYYNRFSDEEIVAYIAKTMYEEISKCSPSESEDLVISKYTALGMWMNYPKDLSCFSSIKPEMEFRFPVVDDIEFVGKVDGLVEKDGKLWVRELKTTALSYSQFENRAKTSPQATGYIWGMRRLGHPVVGVIYDYIKKPLLRKNKSEDMHQFGHRIVEDYKNRPNEYFKRHYSYRSDEDLNIFEKDMIQVAKEIQRHSKANDWYRNPDSCWNFNSECPYKKVCFQSVPDSLTVQLYFTKQPSINKGGTDVGE